MFSFLDICTDGEIYQWIDVQGGVELSVGMGGLDGFCGVCPWRTLRRCGLFEA